MNFEQFDKYLAQLKEVMGQAADTVIRGVFAMNLSTVIFAVSALILMVFAARKVRNVYLHGKFDNAYLTADGLVLAFWCAITTVSGLAGIVNLTETLWKVFAPDFAAVEFILKLISKG